MAIDEIRIQDLEHQLAELSNQVIKLQNELLKASKWENEDPDKRISGIQVFLGRAGEAKGRKAQGRRR